MRLTHIRRSINFFSVIVLVALVAFLAGCSGSSGGSTGTAPTIATQPANATVTAGQTAMFSVTASGTSPFTYQWQKNGSNISGATNATYTTPVTTLADSGTAYYVVVSNTFGTITSHSATLTVNPAAALQSIAVTPASPSLAAGRTLQFKATGTYTDNSSQDITTSVNWSSSKTAFATIGMNTGLATGVAIGVTQITATLGNITSPNDPLTVTPSANASDVVTYHNDIARTGNYANETILTTNNVKSATFGKVAEFAVDGQIDGQILFLNQVPIPGAGNKNVLYFATEKDSVYAVDADSATGSTATVLWKTSVLPSGEQLVIPSDAGCGYINPVGVMSTPVIDRSRNAIYVVATSKDGKGGYFHRLHALDLTTGKELFGGPTNITATYPGNGGNVTFQPRIQQERAALLESGNTIYTAWSGYYGDCGNYAGWVMAFSADNLQPLGVINLVPNSGKAGIWLGGGGPAADSSGNVYVATGNASGGNTPGMNSDYGDTFVKISGTAPLAVLDYFAPSNAIMNDNADADFGSAGALLLPDLVDSSNITRHLAIEAGKDGFLYVINRDNLGQYSAMKNSDYQDFSIGGNENFSSPVYFNGTVYIGPSGLPLKAFTFSNALLSTTPTSSSANNFGGSGTVPSVSSNGTSNGIVWALDGGNGTLYAYDATNLATELYDSNQAANSRDRFGSVGGHFITPMVANGKVYFGTGTTLVVFGLLP